MDKQEPTFEKYWISYKDYKETLVDSSLEYKVKFICATF